jgi:membrane protease YdiL (CAAX protease family)
VAGERTLDVDATRRHEGAPRLQRWAAAAPVPMSIGLLAVWMVASGLAGGVWAAISGSSVGEAVPQLVARLTGSVLVLALLWRARWLREAGVSVLGGSRAWVVGLLAIAYLAPGYVVAMFGLDGLRALPDALAAGFPEQWVIQASVGFAEELLFRGLLLVVLAAAWGRTGRGGLAVAIGVGVLFGVPHLIVLAGGIDPTIATLNMVAAIVSGVWYGAVVLAYRTIWPLVIVHAATNLAVLVLPMTTDAAGYLRLIAVELPWLVFGVWLVLRRPIASVSLGNDG